jgi:hypothetical protein
MQGAIGIEKAVSKSAKCGLNQISPPNKLIMKLPEPARHVWAGLKHYSQAS